MQCRKSNVAVSSRFISLLTLFFPSFFSLLIFIFSFSLQTVLAHPQGDEIGVGHGLGINQNPGKGIINQQGLNIGGPEAVPLIQHGTDSGAMNQVFQADPSPTLSVILGSGSKKGDGISDQDFPKRNDNLFKNPTNGLTSIFNQGTINGSHVGFGDSSANNHGTIAATLGSMSLDSGEAVTMDFIGNDLINFAINEDIEGTATDAEGNIINHNISNRELTQANVSQVTLSVRRAWEIIRNAVNQSEVIEARTVIEKEGRIYLSGDDLTLAKNTLLSATWNTTKEEEQQRQLQQGVNAGFNFLDDFAASNSNCIFDLPLPLVPLITIEFPISWSERPTELVSDNPRLYKIDPDCILFNPALR